MSKLLHAILAVVLIFAVQDSLLAQPANDECENAIAVGFGSHDFSSIDATSGGPAFPQNCPSDDSSSDSLYNDIWYLYTADFTGLVQFSTCSMADFDTNLGVYGPNAPCPPTDDDLIDCSEDAAGCTGFSSSVSFAVVSGETYLLRIGGWGGSSPGEEGTGTFTLSEFVPPLGPPNDDCDTAIDLVLDANDSTYVEFESLYASDGPPEHLEPLLCFAADESNVYNDVWYRWTATFTGGLEWSNCGTTNFDSRMAVYDSNVCPPDANSLVGCSDDGVDENAINCPGYTSRALFNVEEGKTYLFRLGGFNNGDAGDGSFYVRRIPLIVPPANDPCASPEEAYIITEQEADDFEVFFEGNTSFASGQPEYPNPVCRNDGEFWDVWYRFNSGVNTEISLRFNKVTLNAEFIVDIFETCGVRADSSWCIRSDEQNNTFFDQAFTGFPGTPTEYLLRVSTQVTNDAPGNFWFQLVGIPVSGLGELQVENFRFYPNPVNEQANMSFRMKEALESQVEIVNTLGQVVQRIDYGRLPAGEQNLSFSTANLGKGVYFLRLLAEGRQKTVRFVKQ